MTEALTSYLLQYQSLSIPGLGSLYIERIPAQTDFVNKRILPPDYHFRFDKYFDAPDKDFFTYLAQQNEMVDYEAIKWYNEWAYELRSEIRNGHPVEWPGIGTLKKDISGDIIFEPVGAIPGSLQPAAANRVIRNRSHHTMLVGDREVTKEFVIDEDGTYTGEEEEKTRSTWWIYALIIAAVALAVIFYHFYSNGFVTSSTGNSSTVPLSK